MKVLSESEATAAAVEAFWSGKPFEIHSPTRILGGMGVITHTSFLTDGYRVPPPSSRWPMGRARPRKPK